jgi:hypothetical protein
MNDTEYNGTLVSTVPNSEGPSFKSRSGDRLSWGLSWFLSRHMRIPRYLIIFHQFRSLPSPSHWLLDHLLLAQKPNSALGLRFLDNTIRHTPAIPPNEWSARRRGSYIHNTQQRQETNSHALSGIRTLAIERLQTYALDGAVKSITGRYVLHKRGQRTMAGRTKPNLGLTLSPISVDTEGNFSRSKTAGTWGWEVTSV